MSDSPATTRKPLIRADTLIGVVLLATVIWLSHGNTLHLGLFMDDHAHFRQLRACDWSLSGLTDACRLDLIGDTVEYWWLPDVTLRFFRPLAFGLMKATYTVLDWNPRAMHGVSLVWHLLTCTLLMFFLRCCGANRPLAWICAALFAIHPGHVATVQWIACQTELMVTSFLLGATLCFGRFRGWPGFGGDAEDDTHGWGWAAGSALLFLLALGCRENAVMFPFVLATIEPIVWRRRVRGTLVLYGCFLVMLVGYLLLRAQQLGGTALPPRPYVFPPSDPDFSLFVFNKVCYYLLGEFLMVPCIPIAGMPYFQERPLVFYGLTALVVVLLVGVCRRFFRRAPGVIGPAWLLGFMAPVLPVFASPHHLYLPCVGWAVVLMILLRGIGTVAKEPAAGVRRWLRPATMWVLAIGIGAVFAWVTSWQALSIETGHEVETCVVEEIAAAPTGLEDGDTIYIANLPLVAHYTRLILEERTGCKDLRVIPLTWAPRILGTVTPTELVWLSDRSIEMHVADDRFFEGGLGRVAREVTGGPVPDAVDCWDTYGFRVRALQRDEKGIQVLRFDFARPLTDPDLHLFWGSRARWACEVHPMKGEDEHAER